MPTNPDYEYSNAMKEYLEANTDEEKLKSLQKMLSKAPNHKSSQVLRGDIKTRISKLREKLQKQKLRARKGFSVSVKKEGAATIALVGTTNTGKSTLLNKLTGSKAKVGDYEYTTKLPEVGIFDYKGIKLQIIEIPSIFENFEETERGRTFLSLIRQSDLIILFFKNPEEKNMLSNELNKVEIKLPVLIYNDQKDIGDLIWQRLPLIKVQTKMPGKKPDYPPLALKKGSTIEDLAIHVHKDFLKKFKFARVWGKSVKYSGQTCGYNHILGDEDIVELHTRKEKL